MVALGRVLAPLIVHLAGQTHLCVEIWDAGELSATGTSTTAAASLAGLTLTILFLLEESEINPLILIVTKSSLTILMLSRKQKKSWENI